MKPQALAPYTFRPATVDDGPDMLALLPELAGFELPPARQPEHLWHGDAALIEDWLKGSLPEAFGVVAQSAPGAFCGFAFVTLREELLSHAPSAHLEVLVVRPQSRRDGVGAALCRQAHDEARRRGASSMTLHVFANNVRARALYAKLGYEEELIRAIRYL